MSEWEPKLKPGGGPLYQAIADALVDDVASGRLPPGARLPTHRDLARQLGASLGTVTRAYREAQARGAIDAAPGRGSFVRRLPSEWPPAAGDGQRTSGLVDLSVAHPQYRRDPELAPALRTMAERVDVQRLLRYQTLNAIPRYRDAGYRWLSECGVDAAGCEINITAGAQHGGFVILSVLTRPGDLVVTDELTYPGFLSAAELRGVRVAGIPMDDEGMDPEALREVCRRDHPRVLYLVPTLQNPTGILVSHRRREALAAIAEEHDLLVIEDDTLRLLVADAPPTVTSLIPHRSFFIATMSKAVAGGLRLAFTAGPPSFANALDAAIGATAFTVSPILLELGTTWLEDGTAMATVAGKRDEIRQRQRLARKILGDAVVRSHLQSYYLWIPCPRDWSGAEFEAEARRRGVGVTGTRPFAVRGTGSPEGVRVCLSAAEDREQLAAALRTLGEMLAQPESRTPRLV